ncbi:MAG: helix-turn-helix domain-containing protein [Oscillospiraceae bacterium]|nr:helix-turn-helix transcriptional regulator [Ruminococcus sp. AM43-6]UYJ32182.1 MAG: helix-turn-helix domain-containing protein [Oscillospiraceae bacterium]
MAVTNNIREIREQRGIFQDDLAAAIGFSTKTVGRIERGDSTPSAEFMLRISKYSNLLVEDVFHVEDWRCKKTALKESRFPAFGKSRLFFMPDRKNNYFG